MDYQLDLDPTHQVLRVTIAATVLTLELVEDCSRSVALAASRGGPYAAIIDLSGVTGTTLSANEIRGWALRVPDIPGDRIRVMVAKEPVIFGVSRMFELNRDSMGGILQVVHSLEEAYEIVGVRPEDFTERLCPKQPLAA